MSGHISKSKLLNDRMDFLGLGSEQKRAIADIAPIIVGSLDRSLDLFYAKAKTHPDTKKFFANEAHVQHAKSMQKQHWSRLAGGKIDEAYVDAVSAVGRTHARLGLEPRWYIGAYALILEEIIRAIITAELKGFMLDRKAKKVAGDIAVTMKVAFLDMDYGISVYLEALAQERQKVEEERVRLEAEQEEAMHALDSALNGLAAGDLTSTINQSLAPQFDRLKANYNKSIAKLENAFSEIIRASKLVSSNTNELSAATDDMAKRTEQQASSLEQTAAAIEQITAISQQSAMRTRDAQAVVRNSAEEAIRSGEVVGQAVQAMSAIETSSQKITQIIGVIDEIAFQTNLLALNAGVEAARAGEAGRGFAVVAQEVRELAQRSANAAKEIKSLIDKSFQDVVLGVSLVNKTGEALTSIGQQVHSINEHITAIASSAQEQSAGVNEINTAINNMDRVTQQNAAMVQETNMSTRNLTEASNTLARLVASFTVSGSVRFQENGASFQRRYA